MQARMWDKLACVRSLISVDEHCDTLVMTGYSENINRTAAAPVASARSISKLRERRGRRRAPVRQPSWRRSVGTEPGYLGIAHRPFTPSGPGLENLRLANGVTTERMGDRKDLLGSFDNVRRDIDASGTMKGMDSFAGRASTWSRRAPSAVPST